MLNAIRSNRILSYGLVAGLFVGTSLLVTTWALKDVPLAENHLGMILGYASMLIALSVIFVAIKRRRDIDNGGVIKFLPAFLMGLGISAVAGIIYALAWEVTLAVTGFDFAAVYADAMIESAKLKGVSGTELDKIVAETNSFIEMYANPLFRIPITFTEIFPVGLLVSLVSALLLRNSRFMPARQAIV